MNVFISSSEIIEGGNIGPGGELKVDLLRSFLLSIMKIVIRVCFLLFFQSQLGHGAGFPYSTAPGGGRPDYSVTTPQRPHDDPLSLHQALGQAVEEAQGGIDDNTGFISDLPLLKSKHCDPPIISRLEKPI
jgi:hypothetical protein